MLPNLVQCRCFEFVDADRRLVLVLQLLFDILKNDYETDHITYQIDKSSLMSKLRCILSCFAFQFQDSVTGCDAVHSASVRIGYQPHISAVTLTLTLQGLKTD